jgi:lipopolysaccharide biosynthesis protein
LGDKWRKYLYGNLLGNIQIISEIVSDFENFEKLGFIFPETFYECIKFSLELTKQDRKYTNFILNRIFPGFKIEKIFDFPAGNMFWARVDAIYQIFEETNQDLFPNEENQKSGTIIHGIERVWTYLIKLNGFYYKKIFKYI